MEKSKEPELPPERFAHLLPDAGINSPEALRLDGDWPEPSATAPEGAERRINGA